MRLTCARRHQVSTSYPRLKTFSVRKTKVRFVPPDAERKTFLVCVIDKKQERTNVLHVRQHHSPLSVGAGESQAPPAIMQIDIQVEEDLFISVGVIHPEERATGIHAQDRSGFPVPVSENKPAPFNNLVLRSSLSHQGKQAEHPDSQESPTLQPPILPFECPEPMSRKVGSWESLSASLRSS